mmetsp:Transcript_22062/g.27856  ORF Transcript_22062/g.27856 Transcript_22062/m.27856 type:complete len:325 (-) Transcript_22062:75-1049(-)
MFQLLLSFLITLFSVMASNWARDDDERVIYQRLTIGWSLLQSGWVSIDTYVKPRLNWQHLRCEAVNLESIIWKFRMRVGEFEEDARNKDRFRPEKNLSAAFHDWQENLSMGAGKSASTVLTSLNRKYRSDAAKMNFTSQRSIRSASDDNHYSTVDGDDYANHRVNALIERYQRKISANEWSRMLPQLIIVFTGVVIAFISELGYTAVVTIVTALLSSFNLYLESIGFFEKFYLYSSAVSACTIEKSKWNANSNFQKRNRITVHNFVMEIETFVSQVMSSWSTTMASKKSTLNPLKTSGRDSSEGPIIKSKALEDGNRHSGFEIA